MRARHLRRTILLWLSLGLYALLRRRRLRRASHVRTRRRQWRHTRATVRAAKPARASTARVGAGATGAVALSALVAGGALTYSEQAHAISVDNIANQVSHKTMKMLKKVLGPLLQVLEDFISGQNDKTVAAIGMNADSINTTAVELHNKRAMAAAEAPPDPCGSTNLALDTQSSGENAAVGSARTDLRMTAQLSTRSAAQASNAMYTRVLYHQSHFGPTSANPFGDRSTAWLSQTQFSQKDEQAGLGYADNFMGQTRDGDIALPPDVQNTKAAAPYEDLRATYAARRSACMRPVLSALSKRTPAPGQSSAQENMTAEVSRTYGGSKWRSRIDEYDDPTPLAKEQCKLMAFQNKLLLEQLQALEEGNVVLSAIGLELMENPDKMDRLNNAYEQAAGAPDLVPLKQGA